MPDRKVLPLVVTSDERAQSMNTGIGNVNLSPLGAFMEGFTSSAAAWTDISAKQLETKRLNDPARIAAEQLRIDLANKKLQQEIEKAKVEALYQREIIEADLASSRANTDFRVMQNEVYAQTGLEAAQTNIAATKQNISSARTNQEIAEFALTQDRKYADRDRELAQQTKEQDIRTAETNRDIALDQNDRAAIEFEEGTVSSKEQLAARREQRAQIAAQLGQLTAKENSLQEERNFRLRQASAESSKTRAFSTSFTKAISDDNILRKEYEELSKAEQSARQTYEKIPNKESSQGQRAAQKLAEAQQSITKFKDRLVSTGRIPAPGRDPQVNTEDIDSELASIRAQRDKLASVALVENETARTENNRAIKLAQRRAERELDNVQDSDLTVSVADDYYKEGRVAVDAATPDNLNAPAVYGSLLKMTQAAKRTKDPVVKKQLQDDIADIMSRASFDEGVEPLIEEISAGIADKGKREAFTKSLYEAAVVSGRTDILTPKQQQILAAGLGTNQVANPDQVTRDIATLMGPKANTVQDPVYIDFMMHPYFRIAQQASKGGTQTYTIAPGEPSSAGTPADTAQSQTQNMSTVRFVGADGTVSDSVQYAPTLQNQAVLTLLNETSSSVGSTVATNVQTNAATQGVIQNQANTLQAAEGQQQRAQTPGEMIGGSVGGTTGAAAGGGANTTPAPQTEQQRYISRKIREFEAQAQANGMRPEVIKATIERNMPRLLEDAARRFSENRPAN